MDVLQRISAKVSADVERTYQSIVSDLDKNYVDIRTHYLAAYTQYCTDPCSEEAAGKLDKANEEIRRREFRLRELEVKVEQLSQIARKTNGAALAPPTVETAREFDMLTRRQITIPRVPTPRPGGRALRQRHQRLREAAVVAIPVDGEELTARIQSLVRSFGSTSDQE